MIDLTQILIYIFIIIITFILSLVGFQTYLLLKELRISLNKINTILDNAQQISNLINSEVKGVRDNITNLKNIFSFLKIFNRKK